MRKGLLILGLFGFCTEEDIPHNGRRHQLGFRHRPLRCEPLEDRRLLSIDFGDAPAPYSTLLANDGARHEIVGPMLGASVDSEADGQPTLAALGDDIADVPDDEDGVTFGSISVGQLDTTVTVHVQNAPSGAKLDAWVDFNSDGSWGGPFEQIADSVAVVNGDNVITFDVPIWAVDGDTYARFRLSANGNLGPVGVAGDGEVEDYQITIMSPAAAACVFGQQNVINSVALDGPHSVFGEDLDGDGDMDVLSASYYDDRISWYENEGAQNFTVHDISTTADGARSAFPVDVDGDGDMDVLAASQEDNTIAWHRNDGNQNFTEHVISTNADGATSVFASDIDGDGDLDVLSASDRDDKIAWFENDGTPGGFGDWTEHGISTAADGAVSLFAVDVDSDGDMDVLSASERDGKIAWYENDGSGNFTVHTITTSALGARCVFASDLDADGDMDVLSASQHDDKIAWYENDGNQGFTSHTISTGAEWAVSVFAADMDGDGDIDVLSASHRDHEVAWYENDGTPGDLGDWERTVIDTAAGGAHAVFASDVDGDGDLDILASPWIDDKIVWYENLNAPPTVNLPTSPLFVIGTQSGELLTLAPSGSVIASSILDSTPIGDVSVVDADSNGTLDVVATPLYTAERSAHAYELMSLTELWTTETPASVSSTGVKLYSRQMVWTGDFDSDGILELVIPYHATDVGMTYRVFSGEDGSEEGVITGTNAGSYSASVYLDPEDHAFHLATDTGVSFSHPAANYDLSQNLGGSYPLAWDNSNVNTWKIGSAVTKGGDAVVWGGWYGRTLTLMDRTGQPLWTRSYGGSFEAEAVYTRDLREQGDEVLLIGGSYGSQSKVQLDAVELATGDVLWTFEGSVPWYIGVLDAVDVDEDGIKEVFALTHRGPGHGHTCYALDGATGDVLWELTYDEDLPIVGESQWLDFDSDDTLDIVLAVGNTLEVRNGMTGDLLETYLFDSEVSAFAVADVPLVEAMNEGDAVPLSGSFTDPGSDTWTATVDYGDGSGIQTLALNPDKTFDLSHTYTDNGEYTVVVTVEDDESGSGSGNLFVMVNNVPPTADAGGPYLVSEGASVGLDATGSTDPGDDVLTYAWDFDGDGEYDDATGAQPDFSAAGLDGPTTVAIGLQVTDDDGATDTDSVQVVVMQVEPVDLGVVDFKKLSGLNLAVGNVWYQLTTAHHGILTAIASSGSGTVTAALYDTTRTEPPFAVSSATTDSQRLDQLAVLEGETYLLKLFGDSNDAVVTVANMVNPEQPNVQVFGTDGVDHFEFAPTGSYLVTINGVEYHFDDTLYNTVVFNGRAGDDTATLTGSPGTEVARFFPDHGTFGENGFLVTVNEVTTITAFAGGGLDEAYMYDSSGDDEFLARQGYGKLSGEGFVLETFDFMRNYGYSINGGTDEASLKVTSGSSSRSERVKVYPGFVKLMGSDCYNRAKLFETTTVEMSGGEDSGVVNATSGVDVLWATKDEIRVARDVALAAGAPPAFESMAFDVTITGCERLVARAKGGDDWVELHDSALNDVLIAKPHKIEMMNGPRSAENVERGDEYKITARAYRNMLAIADQGGDGDAAKLYDSGESGVDIWEAGYLDGETWSKMSSPSRLLYEVLAFEHVGGYGFNGGLGSNHGINRKDHAEDIDFVFEFGVWEVEEPVLPRVRGRF